MYNLKRVYVAATFNPDHFHIVLSENKNNSFHLIWSQSYPNEGLYDRKKVINSIKLKDKLKEVLGKASAYVGSKILKVLVSFENILDDLSIRKITTNTMTFVNKWHLIYKQVNAYTKQFCKVDPYLKQTNVFSWKVLNFIDTKNEQEVDSLEVGHNYQANVQIYSSKNPLVDQINAIFYNTSYQVLNNSCPELDLHSMLKQPKADKIVVNIQSEQTVFATYSNGALIHLSKTKFGENDVFAFVHEKSSATNISLPQIKNLVYNHLNQLNQKPINLVCKTNDQFLNMGFLSNQQLLSLIVQSLSQIADALNSECQKITKKFHCQIEQIVVYSNCEIIALAAEELAKIMDEKLKISAYKNTMRFLRPIHFLTGLAIMRQVQEDNLLGREESCLEVFYSESFDKKFDRNLTFLSLSKDVSQIVQKIIK